MPYRVVQLSDGSDIIYGLSTEAKPSGEKFGSMFIEVDTGKHYTSCQSGWLTDNSGGGVTSFTAENKDVVTIKAGQPVAVHSSGSGVILASAASVGSRAVGFAAVDIGVGLAGKIQFGDILKLSDWTPALGHSSLDAKAKYFLQETAGTFGTTPPGAGILQRVGEEANVDSLVIEVSEPILL